MLNIQNKNKGQESQNNLDFRVDNCIKTGKQVSGVELTFKNFSN